MEGKIAITCACTGAETTKAQNPALPVTPEEIAEAACEARRVLRFALLPCALALPIRANGGAAR